jgi:hypothetical protein
MYCVCVCVCVEAARCVSHNVEVPKKEQDKFKQHSEVNSL